MSNTYKNQTKCLTKTLKGSFGLDI
jgi:hypothetical protein